MDQCTGLLVRQIVEFSPNQSDNQQTCCFASLAQRPASICSSHRSLFSISIPNVSKVLFSVVLVNLGVPRSRSKPSHPRTPRLISHCCTVLCNFVKCHSFVNMLLTCCASIVQASIHEQFTSLYCERVKKIISLVFTSHEKIKID